MHDGVHGQNRRHRSDDAVSAGKDAAIMGTVTDRDNDFRRGRRFIGALEWVCHVARHRAGHEQTIGMARRGDEMHAEAFDIVVRIIQRADLQLATVARSGVHFANVQRSAKTFACMLIYPLR